MTILELDRSNMGPILSASGLDFPQAERVARLSDPATRVVVARAANTLAAYVDFAPDPKNPRGIYVSSLQIARAYRHGLALAHVLGRMAQQLQERPPDSIRIDVQRLNAPALALFERLGFRLLPAARRATTLRAVGGPEVFTSPLFQRLACRLDRISSA